jgi:hypothetical protein
MVQGMATSEIQFDQFQEFSMQHQLVREEVNEVAIQVLSAVYQPLHDCTCDMHSRRSPNCDRHHENAELHGQSKLLLHCSKRIGHRREQILHDVKVELHGDTESLQIY